ncbi:DegT/DnrJ/EryC1/StrS family aminotransferase [Eubacterium limosum]|uniref:DegT/DnrJ/EryC1/StrS family aminotransferase n=1 Tax=Eubacterium limosum TaxID=1736 RepID=UPI001063D9F2|nr:DegT/DnrJ/EryC1/StrS family aminotransferase [Eubacterium limosum]
MSDKILVTKSSMPSIEEYIEEIKPLWDSHWLTNMGVKHKKLEKELKNYLMVRNISLMVNGHMALELAIQAMKLRGEVITTPFTFASTTHAIIRNGLKPVFCDINLKDFTLDVNKIESLITKDTTAIIPVHVYGNICKVEEIECLAEKYGLKVIYDAAHAFGVKYKGRGIGDFGDATMFSFHATKVFNTIEGGAVCFSDKNYGTQLYRLKNFGIRNEDVVDAIGANAKMNEFQAAMGICNLRHIENEIAKRKKIVGRYKENLSRMEGISFSKEQEHVTSNYAYMPILINEDIFGVNRNNVYEQLMNHGIYARKYFYPLTNTFSCFKNKFETRQTPTAIAVSEQVLTLPLYADLKLEKVDEICSFILKMKK